MAKTLGSEINKVLYRLGDTSQTIWTVDEVRSYIREGYDKLAIMTGCFWDQAYMEDRLTTANLTNDWEVDYLDANQEATWGIFKYTSPDEQDYLEPGEIEMGPTSLNHDWESAYLDPTFFFYRATDTLPEDLYQVDRAVWDWKKIEPVRSVQLENIDRRYWVQNGEVIGYILDKDGLRTFRKWRVPSVQAQEYTITEVSWGIMRSPADISADTVMGTWGIPRRIPSMHPMGNTGGWGFPRRPFQETKNTRIEFSRRGRPLDVDDDEFELPDRYVAYVRHYALWKALERDGDGQDLDYAAHWQGRFLAGVARMLVRKNALAKNQRNEISDARMVNLGKPPLARYPWQYGRVVGYPSV